jgi:hypothetical protein
MRTAAVYVGGKRIGEGTVEILDIDTASAAAAFKDPLFGRIQESTATFEASFTIDDAEFRRWVESLCFRISRVEKRARKRWFRNLRRDLVRQAGSHKRWSRGWSRGMGLGPGLCGASVPRSFR